METARWDQVQRVGELILKRRWQLFRHSTGNCSTIDSHDQERVHEIERLIMVNKMTEALEKLKTLSSDEIKALTDAIKDPTLLAKVQAWLDKLGDNNGKFELNDVWVIFKGNGSKTIWTIIWGLIITAFGSTISNWFSNGIWDWNVMILSFQLAIIPSISGYIKKLADQDITDLTNSFNQKLKEKENEIETYKAQLIEAQSNITKRDLEIALLKQEISLRDKKLIQS